jgi:hypothetical protein
LVALVAKQQIELVADMIAYRLGHGNAARPGDALQPRGNVDPVAEQIVIADDHVAEVDADAQLDPAVVRDVLVAGSHAALDRRGTFDRTDHARNAARMPSP